jgi:8-oxo-dGTP diphosphatase
VREWLVASGVIEGPDGLLLVQNQRRNGSLDWSTPGGVIEVHEGESVVDGLTREVEEETGIRVEAWEGPLWQVDCVAEGLGWHLRAEIHRALTFKGEIHVDDPDGIVVDARWVPHADCGPHLEACQPWVREPLTSWLDERWLDDVDGGRSFNYRIDGDHAAGIAVIRL